MTFLEILNSRATRSGLIVWSLFGGIGGFALGLYGRYRETFTCVDAYIFIAWMTVAGAVAAGAVYWQTPDETVDD